MNIRKEITHILVRFFIKSKIFLGRSDCMEVAKLVKISFETEDEDFYYSKPEPGQRVPRGKIYNRYQNQLYKLRISGLYEYKNKKTKKCLKETFIEPSKYTFF